VLVAQAAMDVLGGKEGVKVSGGLLSHMGFGADAPLSVQAVEMMP